MFSKTITYTNLRDQEVTEELWFHLNTAEAVELEVSRKGGLQSYVDEIVKAEDFGTLVSIFKELICLSYGEKVEDSNGNLRFVKNQDLVDRFTQTDAYSALFMDLVTDTDKAIEFFNNLVPKEVREKYAKQNEDPNELSDAALLKMSDEDFYKAAGSRHQKDWDRRFLILAIQRKGGNLAQSA